MVKDHHRLMNYLKKVEDTLEDDHQKLKDAFDRFRWNVEKHFFVEERAIFTFFNPDKIHEGYHVFSNLSKQHTAILQKIDALEKKVQQEASIDVHEIKDLLMNHKKYEERQVYPTLDEEIAEGEKRFMVERIQEIQL
jgi:hemerythrin superfamily protein